MKNLGYNVLFICPSNKLVREHQIYAITIKQFFGFGVDNSEHMKAFDASGYNCIVFDEIYFYDVFNLTKILTYSNRNPDKIILATGDINQSECINSISNVKNYEHYINHCINTIFNKEIYLLENKRLKNVEDRQKLKELKHDILNTTLDITEIITKYQLKNN